MATYWLEEVPIAVKCSGLKILYYQKAGVIRFLRTNGRSLSIASWTIRQTPEARALLRQWIQDMDCHEAALAAWVADQRRGSTG